VKVVCHGQNTHIVETRPISLAKRSIRVGWLVLGLVFVGLGFVGVVTPLMPTTFFLILAAGCFTRSSPRLEVWLPGSGPIKLLA